MFYNHLFTFYDHLDKAQQYNVADKNPIVVGAAIGFLKILSVIYSPVAYTNSCQISFILCYNIGSKLYIKNKNFHKYVDHRFLSENNHFC